MKSSMIRPVRTEAGLGNPPSEFSTNDVEAANFIVKYGLHFDPEKPHVFIESKMSSKHNIGMKIGPSLGRDHID